MDEMKVKKERKKYTVNPEKRIAAIDAQIAKLQAEREALAKPIRAKKLLDQIALEYSPEEIASKFGISID